jgi:four helix bundle protein
MAVASCKGLTVWQDGISLTVEVYKLTYGLPDQERFGLVRQMRRSAVSVPSNIAEGHGRLSTREYLKQVSYALGSLAELETQLHIAMKLGYVANDGAKNLASAADRLGKQLRSLTKSLRKRLDEESK